MTILNLIKMAESTQNWLKTLREKEKLLITSNFSFSHSVFKTLTADMKKSVLVWERVKSKMLLKTSWQQEKMQLTSIFSTYYSFYCLLSCALLSLPKDIVIVLCCLFVCPFINSDLFLQKNSSICWTKCDETLHIIFLIECPIMEKWGLMFNFLICKKHGIHVKFSTSMISWKRPSLKQVISFQWNKLLKFGNVVLTLYPTCQF